MALMGSIKDAVIHQAMKLASNPKVAQLASNPALMNVAMKALAAGGKVKQGVEHTGRAAAAVFGFATHEEVATLRGTIQNLEDQVAMLESRAASAKVAAGRASKPARA